MKIYLVAHNASSQPYNMMGWVDIDRVGINGIYVKSVRAFLKKKEAKEYIKRRGYDHLIIKTAVLEK